MKKRKPSSGRSSSRTRAATRSSGGAGSDETETPASWRDFGPWLAANQAIVEAVVSAVWRSMARRFEIAEMHRKEVIWMPCGKKKKGGKKK